MGSIGGPAARRRAPSSVLPGARMAAGPGPETGEHVDRLFRGHEDALPRSQVGTAVTALI